MYLTIIIAFHLQTKQYLSQSYDVENTKVAPLEIRLPNCIVDGVITEGQLYNELELKINHVIIAINVINF